MPSVRITGDLSPTPSPGRTRFTEFLVRHNDITKNRFDRWVFQPGMLFNSPHKWWGDRGRRDTSHEGLDLCWYRAPGGRINSLDENTRIPVLYDGRVAAVISDFLGQSVIVEHKISGSGGIRFCSIYGHTHPSADLQTGSSVKEGEVIATIADSRRSKSGIRAHLHISLGWADNVIAYDRFDWETLATGQILHLLDPLDVLDGPYQVLQPGSSAT